MKASMKLLISGCLAAVMALSACSSDGSEDTGPIETDDGPILAIDREETFNFSSNETVWEGTIWIPASYNETNNDVPVIYLVDHIEEPGVSLNEFKSAQSSVKEVSGLTALVITLSDRIEYSRAEYQKFTDVFNDMVTYVDANYANNLSRTFIGKGQAASMVLRNLFEDETPVFQNFIASDTSGMTYLIDLIENKEFSQEPGDKKLHYSFTSTTDNDQNINLINTISGKGLTWLDFESAQYPSLTYTNSSQTVFTAGLQFIYGN